MVTIIVYVFCPSNGLKTRLLLLLSSYTKYDHELTLHKIVNAKNLACMCVLFVHLVCMFGAYTKYYLRT